MQPESPIIEYQPRPPEPHRICGGNPVRAVFLRRPEAVQRLFYTEAMRRVAGPLCAHLARTRRPYREVLPDELARIAGTPHHGGICAITQVRYAERLPAHALPADLPVSPLLPVLDRIGNPHNLGAIARSAAFFGCRGLLLSDDAAQADLSDAAFRTAEGGLELLRVMRARALPELLRGMRGQYLVVAAVAAGGVAPAALPRNRPLALVLGNEEQGPAADVLEASEAGVTLRGGGMVESLNVSAAAAVLFHALAGTPAQAAPRPAPPPRPKAAPSPGRLQMPRR
ncbi:TrmH family RNA methyltransferase [Paeniroseomonas aquatica]|uniref:RNA methyltransferase n=1 Tax=Paeniroseomonas aquatica TaxID=373043 RepID=A0ABT8A4K3_9PROT|nr:RNA methyltransferase [Paeniroseomonas aquatica]MDN3564640.1 RNA methyltransferase [Paeniroseomonas aquatica]